MAEEKASVPDRKGMIVGMPWWQCLAFVLLCAAPMYLGVESDTMTGTLCSVFAFGIFFHELGERLPIWNTYLGGGLFMCFVGVALLRQEKLIPKATIRNITSFVSEDANFLELFIILLIVGSILALERNILIKSFVRYVPTIFGGFAMGGIAGITVGEMLGMRMKDIIIYYVLPIMGGGNGGGAVPMSNIYETVTGRPAAIYYSFAIVILTIANIFCIIFSAIINKLGDRMPRLTGDKKTLLRNGRTLERDEIKVKTEVLDMIGALLLMFGVYALSRILSRTLIPTIAGATIHVYAYMILIVVALAATGIIPANIRAGAKRLQGFFSRGMGIVVMSSMGAEFDLAELYNTLSVSNIIMALVIVIGATIGSGIIGYLVGFYPIDSALTAGLCLSSRGGNGYIACLGAAHRMDLIAYASLSSRLGGGIVLVIASFVFSSWLR